MWLKWVLILQAMCNSDSHWEIIIIISHKYNRIAIYVSIPDTFNDAMNIFTHVSQSWATQRVAHTHSANPWAVYFTLDLHT